MNWGNKETFTNECHRPVKGFWKLQKTSHCLSWDKGNGILATGSHLSLYEGCVCIRTKDISFSADMA